MLNCLLKPTVSILRAFHLKIDGSDARFLKRIVMFVQQFNQAVQCFFPFIRVPVKLEQDSQKIGLIRVDLVGTQHSIDGVLRFGEFQAKEFCFEWEKKIRIDRESLGYVFFCQIGSAQDQAAH